MQTLKQTLRYGQTYWFVANDCINKTDWTASVVDMLRLRNGEVCVTRDEAVYRFRLSRMLELLSIIRPNA